QRRPDAAGAAGLPDDARRQRGVPGRAAGRRGAGPGGHPAEPAAARRRGDGHPGRGRPRLISTHQRSENRRTEMKFANSAAGRVAAALLAALALAGVAPAQRGRGPRGPAVVSPEVKADRTVVFRIHAPRAESVGLFTTDLPGGAAPRPLKKG